MIAEGGLLESNRKQIDTLQDESYALKHDKRGLLSLKIDGARYIGSEFCISFDECRYFDRVHCVIGQLVEGEDVLS